MCDGQGLICMCAAPRPPPALLYPRREGQFAASSAPSALPGSLELRKPEGGAVLQLFVLSITRTAGGVGSTIAV